MGEGAVFTGVQWGVSEFGWRRLVEGAVLTGVQWGVSELVGGGWRRVWHLLEYSG
jgi:hypothetical protein